MGDWLRIAVWDVVSSLKSRWDVALENIALRQQLMVLQRQTEKVQLRDRDRVFWVWHSSWSNQPPSWAGTAAFARRVEAMKIEEVATAPASPWQNPYCECLIGSIRRECLDRVIVRNERHLLRALDSYASYCHASRTHRSLDGDCPDPRPVEPPGMGAVVAHAQVGGLHHRYGRRVFTTHRGGTHSWVLPRHGQACHFSGERTLRPHSRASHHAQPSEGA